MTWVRPLRALASIVICGSVLAFCLLPSIPWAQSRGGTRVPEPEVSPEEQFTRSYALLVGVSAYKFWPKLPGVKEDIEAMGNLLAQQGFEVETVMPSNYDDLERAYSRFFREKGSVERNRLVLYFAGHGTTLATEHDKNKKLSYIVPPEAPASTDKNAEELRQHLYPLSRMNAFAEEAQARHILFAFDSCFAGDWLTRGDQEVSDKHLAYLASKPVRQFITAGGSGETVPDHSLFRRLFEHALRDGAADGNGDWYVTGTELKTYLQKQVFEFSRDTQHPQFGVSRVLGLDQGDFIFRSMKVRPSPPPASVPAPVPFPTPLASSLPPRARLEALGGEWISQPAGTFTMGSNDEEDNEKPPHQVTVSAFQMSKTEVTVAQYQACVEAKGCTEPETYGACNYERKNRDDHPINCVDWNQAKAFAAWVGGRLPTEAEWEYAARGSAGRKYPWGDAPEPSCDVAVMRGCGDSTASACSRASGNTPTGLCDMAGNVWEWVLDCYESTFAGAPNDGTPRTRCASPLRVIRAGGWSHNGDRLRAAIRFGWGADNRSFDVGFRVLRVPPANGP